MMIDFWAIYILPSIFSYKKADYLEYKLSQKKLGGYVSASFYKTYKL